MTVRVTRTALGHQQATVQALWAQYSREVVDAARHANDRAANRPVSFGAWRNNPEDYLRWHGNALAALNRMRVR
jgi:hypothetical protein